MRIRALILQNKNIKTMRLCQKTIPTPNPEFKRLVSSTKSQYEMKGRLLLDVIIGKGPTVFELLSGEDQTLLFWWDSFLVLDLGLHVLNGVVRLDVQGDRLSREGLDEDLHGPTAKTKDKMKGRFFLNVVIRKSSAVFQLLSSEDQSLLLGWDSFFVLNLRLNVLNRVVRLDIQGDRLPRKCLDEDLPH